MRKSDKLKNFKKINLIVENRYLESKGIVTESFHDVDGTPIGVDSNHMPISKPIDEAINLMTEDDVKSMIQKFIREELKAPYRGFLSSDLVLDKKISPRQLDNRIEWVIKTFTEELSYSRRNPTVDSDYTTQWGDMERESGLDEEYISESVGTDLEYITFSVDGEAYRPSKVINKEQVSNGLTVEFGLEKYDGSNWVPTGGMLTYYFDMDTRTDKLLFTNGRFENTIDAKKMIDTKYGLYEKIKQYVETRI